MKTSIISIAILSATLVLASSCIVRVNSSYKSGHRIVADGNLKTETYSLSPFTEIKSSIPGDIVYIQGGEEPRIVIKASKNILPYLTHEVEYGVLTLKFDSDSIATFTAGEITLTVYGKELERVSLSGSGDFNVESLNCKEDFSLSLAGSGDVEIENITCNNCNLSLSGSGDIELSGTVNGKARASIAGSGDISFSGEAAEAELSIAGSGDIDIRDMKVSGAVNYKIAGSGKVHQ